MSISLYEISVPVFDHNLNNLAGLLNKAVEYCREKNLEDAVLLNYRFFPDMYPMVRQVQVACDQAKNSTSRLAGIDPQAIEDTEQTFAELLGRIDKTRAVLKSITFEQLAGSESRPMDFRMGKYQLKFPSGIVYLQEFALPNFYFHLTTCYNMLRHNGLSIGKMNFLGNIQGEFVPL